MKAINLIFAPRSRSAVRLSESHVLGRAALSFSKLSFLVLALSAFFMSHAAQAAAGALDPTFGINGQTLSDFGRSNDIAYATALQSDGKIVVAGIRFIGNSAEGGDFMVARYNIDG